MSLTIAQVQIGSYTFLRNPNVADTDMELLQDVVVALDGSTLVSYVPQNGDTDKIKTKKTFKISGIDPDIDQIESIAAELVNKPPLHFRNVNGVSYQVVAVDGISESMDAKQYLLRDYSLTLKEI